MTLDLEFSSLEPTYNQVASLSGKDSGGVVSVDFAGGQNTYHKYHPHGPVRQGASYEFLLSTRRKYEVDDHCSRI